MEEIKKIEVQGQQYGVADMLMRSVMGGNAQVIEWSHTHNMNDYKDAGTYRIKGERTGNPLEDNLPIMNQGSGHTIEGILYVLDSSLANGSGKEDDCTITQFLMLSNRVGGQEGDMYMRSAYGVSKDNLTWKPWEKYQTNMEVGVVNNLKLLNPNNPTEILKHDSGMNHIIDNGIYSGIYFGPKCMVGTGEDDWHISFQDATAIETFVMVVINNYAAASNARCITQIKFAVTNGGVFSMEKRSTYPGTLSWSQWESVGGGSSPGEWANNNDYFIIRNPSSNALNIVIGRSARIANGFIVSNDLHITSEKAFDLSIGTNMDTMPTISQSKIGRSVYLGNEAVVNEMAYLGKAVMISGVSVTSSGGHVVFRRAEEDAQFAHFEINTDNGVGFTKDYKNVFFSTPGVVIQKGNMALPYNVPIGGDAFHIHAQDDKIVFTYNGKTAELQLT